MIELKPHNLKAVNEIVQSIVDGYKKIIYVSGTGCGKSYVFMGMVEQMQELNTNYKIDKRPKVVYILPKYVIQENIAGYDEFKLLKCDIEFITYNYFSEYEKGYEKLKKADLVVIDECHHLGSDKYGTNIVKCMDSIDALSLGLTATPIRDTDKIDVSVYFDKRVNGITVWDAIHMGLMPSFNYHICLPAQDTKQLEKEYNYEIKAVVDLMDSSDEVKKIIKMYDRKKWICFFSNIEALNNSINQIKDIFVGYDLYVLHSDLNNLQEVVDGIKKSKKAVVLSVNILLEGVHLDDISGIVLYRNIKSTIAFQQMLGRVCSIGKKEEPVVIDTSSTAQKILAKILYENKEKSFTMPSADSFVNKDIIKVGIGSEREYDLNRVLRLMDSKYAKEEGIKEATKKVIEKYYSFNGKKYETFAELKSNHLDYLKFKSCAEICKLAPETAFKYWKEIEEDESII